MQFYQQLFVIVLIGLIIQGLKFHLSDEPEASVMQQNSRPTAPVPTFSEMPRPEPLAIPPEKLVEDIANIREKLGIESVANVLSASDIDTHFADQLFQMATNELPAGNDSLASQKDQAHHAQPLHCADQIKREILKRDLMRYANELEQTNSPEKAKKYRELAEGLEDLLLRR